MGLVNAMLQMKRFCDENYIGSQPGVVLLFNSFEEQIRFREALLRELGPTNIEVHRDGELERFRLVGFEMATGLR